MQSESEKAAEKFVCSHCVGDDCPTIKRCCPILVEGIPNYLAGDKHGYARAKKEMRDSLNDLSVQFEAAVIAHESLANEMPATAQRGRGRIKEVQKILVKNERDKPPLDKLEAAGRKAGLTLHRVSDQPPCTNCGQPKEKHSIAGNCSGYTTKKKANDKDILITIGGEKGQGMSYAALRLKDVFGKKKGGKLR
jgi:hypothetical protein